jgi:hypothetical protein
MKSKEIKLKSTVSARKLETCVGALVTFRRVTNLELMYSRIRRVMWLQNLTEFDLSGENISLPCLTYMQLMMLSRVKNIKQSH